MLVLPSRGPFVQVMSILGWGGVEGLILPEFDEPELEPETKLFFSKLIQYQLLFLLKKSYWLYYMAEAHLTELINNSV